MKIIIFSLLILFTILPHIWAQTGNKTSADQKPNTDIDRVKNVVYLELLGNGVGYSFNYERRLADRLWGRIGAGYSPILDISRLAAFPVGVSYLFGKKSKFLETGLVTTFAYADSDDRFEDTFFEDALLEEVFGIILSPTIGYRYQPQEKNLFFKIAFTPLFTPFEKKFLPSGGLSLGYSF
jgi:hypothetical protein